MCLQKSPTQRPNCEELLQHEHFQPLSDENKRYKYYRRRIKSEICDQIENVGMNKQVTQEGYVFPIHVIIFILLNSLSSYHNLLLHLIFNHLNPKQKERTTI